MRWDPASCICFILTPCQNQMFCTYELIQSNLVEPDGAQGAARSQLLMQTAVCVCNTRERVHSAQLGLAPSHTRAAPAQLLLCCNHSHACTHHWVFRMPPTPAHTPHLTSPPPSPPPSPHSAVLRTHCCSSDGRNSASCALRRMDGELLPLPNSEAGSPSLLAALMVLGDGCKLRGVPSTRGDCAPENDERREGGGGG